MFLIIEKKQEMVAFQTKKGLPGWKTLQKNLQAVTKGNKVTKVEELLRAIGELEDPQIALALLRQCSSFGKVVFIARCTPPELVEPASRVRGLPSG